MHKILTFNLTKSTIGCFIAASLVLASCNLESGNNESKKPQTKLRFLKDKCLFVRGGLKNEREHGIWEYYFSDTTIHSKGEYNLGTRVGKWVFYSENGKLKETGQYWSDKEVIIENLKRDSLKLESDKQFFRNLKSPKYSGDEDIWGICSVDTAVEFDDFDLGDDIEIVGSVGYEMRQNYKHGIWKYYDYNGDLAEIEIFDKGKRLKRIEMKNRKNLTTHQ
ncbi:MAG: hypothetical protein H6581_19695 [Bacteroidia bacterium]|nr:hypothetical protein [Bacteroidia bacterium]